MTFLYNAFFTKSSACRKEYETVNLASRVIGRSWSRSSAAPQLGHEALASIGTSMDSLLERNQTPPQAKAKGSISKDLQKYFIFKVIPDEIGLITGRDKCIPNG